ncbi:spore germination protein [Paenibacillus sp. GCM10023248]|uniref:spore germination protein n=1 Tax=Bacillales TaxID=1385 RepID=UPI002379AF6B|nr:MULTISPECIES: spore germination protein [Bacillales]MDD9265651.1 spore germination protein [Paenibacillus sp. MAHUQ-63]MDR6878891.1 spore germination protein KA [Bacillus sp. 3255]
MAIIKNFWSKTLHQLFNRDKIPTQSAQEQDTVLSSIALQHDGMLNVEQIKTTFGYSADLITGELYLELETNCKVNYAFLEQLINKTLFQSIMNDLGAKASEFMESAGTGFYELPDLMKNALQSFGETKAVMDYKEVCYRLLNGDTVIFVDGYAQALSVNTAAEEQRSVEEPMTQSVVRGPRDGFTESIGTNISLIRKRIKSPNLWLESMIIGRVTQTTVSIMYIKGIVNDKIVGEVRQRLERIDIDGILESGNIEELIQDETFTPFPTVYNTERPDVIAAGLLEGRVAILVDGTPFVLEAPVFFTQFFQSAEDYYQRAEFATLIRMLRYVCFFISLMAPSFYIAITTFHQELLPSSLLFNLAAQREGIPFPAFVEALLMEITFEILREAGVRLPKTVGQAVSIVGALVIGQGAVDAGLVSPAMVIVVAITAIANFVIPAFSMGIPVRIIRFILMIFAAMFGLFGITVGLIAMVQHLCSLRSFGVPYMAPMAPFVLDDQKDTIFRMPQWGLFSRPRFISQNNIIRENNTPTMKPKRK